MCVFGFYLRSIEYIQEDPSEVAKVGQIQALINAVISEVIIIFLK